MKNIFVAMILGLGFASFQTAFADAEEATTAPEAVAEVSEEAPAEDDKVAEAAAD